MNPNPWWNLTRASAIVAWVLMAVAILWGVLLATRVLKPNDRPAWLLDLHRWLGWLGLALVGVHMGTLVADSYVTFTVRDLLVPFSSHWKPFATALGVVAMWILVAVQASSMVMKQISKRIWRAIHLASYGAFALVTAHAILAGSDTGERLFTAFSTSLATVTAAVAALRIVAGHKTQRTGNRHALRD
jgi:predicted ferric reductase